MSNSLANSILESKEFEKDRLSTLSDDILSLIDKKDATRTCILSKSWRYLITNLTNDFNFNASLLKCSKCKGKPFKDYKLRFLNMVNQVLTSNRAPFINEFRICFPLDQTHSNYIDLWIKFAISKGVQKLELDFSTKRVDIDSCYRSYYTLNSNVLNDISYITSLCLKQVKFSEEVIELVMSQCRVLERLHIAYWGKLLKLKIINMSGKLKYLTIDCINLKKLEINAVNLVSFDFTCDYTRMNVVYANVSSLVEAHFHGFYSIGLIPKFSQIKSFSAQLSVLSLVVEGLFNEDLVIPHFPDVRDLRLKVWVDDNFLWLKCFPEACPLLQKFKLEVVWSTFSSFKDSDSESEPVDCNLEYVKKWLEKKESSATLPNLQKLEWVSTFTSNGDEEYMLALYIVKNAIKLKTFILNPQLRVPYRHYNYDIKARAGKAVEASIHHAEKLAMVIPSHIKFVVI